MHRLWGCPLVRDRGDAPSGGVPRRNPLRPLEVLTGVYVKKESFSVLEVNKQEEIRLFMKHIFLVSKNLADWPLEVDFL